MRLAEDKARAVLALLADADLSRLSNREIGRRCGVSHTTAGKLREKLTGRRAPAVVLARRRGTTYAVSTSNLRGRVKTERGARELLRLAASLVAGRQLPADVREEAAQAIAVDLLAGVITREGLTPRPRARLRPRRLRAARPLPLPLARRAG